MPTDLQPKRTNDIHKRFEWWYFHFVSEEFTANIVLHQTDIFGLTRAPYVSLSLIQRGANVQYFKKYLADAAIRYDGNHITTTDKSFVDSDTDLVINLDFEGCSFAVHIHKALQPISIQNSVLYQNSDVSSMWRIDIPYARFEGSIVTQQGTSAVEGVTYQDHQWGSLLIQDFVSQWIWGHLSNSKTNVIFFDILTQSGEGIQRAVVGENDEVSTGVKIVSNSLTEFRADPHFHKNSQRIAVTIPMQHAAEVYIDIQPDGLMRSRLNEGHPGFEASYVRWAVDSARFITLDRQEALQGIVEYLTIKKVP